VSEAPTIENEYSQSKHFARFSDNEDVLALIEAQKFLQQQLGTTKDRYRRLTNELEEVDIELANVIEIPQKAPPLAPPKQPPRAPPTATTTTTVPSSSNKGTTTKVTGKKHKATTSAAVTNGMRSVGIQGGGGGVGAAPVTSHTTGSQLPPPIGTATSKKSKIKETKVPA
jgi:hypothetical protein